MTIYAPTFCSSCLLQFPSFDNYQLHCENVHNNQKRLDQFADDKTPR